MEIKVFKYRNKILKKIYLENYLKDKIIYKF